MRSIFLLCGLALFLLSGIAYTANAPAVAVDPQKTPQEWVSYYEAQVQKCAEKAYGHSRSLNALRGALDETGNFWYAYMMDYDAREYKRACLQYHSYQQDLQRAIAKAKETPTPEPSPTPVPSPTPTPIRLEPIDPNWPRMDFEEQPAQSLDELLDSQSRISKDQNQHLSDLENRTSKLLKEINDYLKKAKTAKPKPPEPGYKTGFDSTSGLFIVKFTTPEGVVKVYLPDDMRAGDTISGSIIPEPNGQTKEERARNRSGLNQYQLVIANSRPGANDLILKLFRRKPPTANTGTVTNSGLSEPCACPVGFSLSASGQPVSMAQAATGPSSAESATCVEGCPGFLAYGNVLDNISGDATTMEAQYLKPLTEAQIDQLYDMRDTAQPPAEPKLNQFRLPTIGQNGRSIEIKGPFDGNLRTTDIKIGGQPVVNLAESPRSCIFKSPEQKFGPTEITVKEGNVEQKGHYRNVGVSLKADTTFLQTGQRTIVTIDVSGLQNIKEDRPLHLEASGVINMDGGNYQYLSIRPQDVKPDGRYTTTRAITGQQAGGFGVTATVFQRTHFIPLTENAAVNGVRVKKVGNSFLFSIENVKDPLKGDPLEGPYEVDYTCRISTKLSRVLASFKKGSAEAPMYCPEGRFVYAGVKLDF